MLVGLALVIVGVDVPQPGGHGAQGSGVVQLCHIGVTQIPADAEQRVVQGLHQRRQLLRVAAVVDGAGDGKHIFHRQRQAPPGGQLAHLAEKGLVVFVGFGPMVAGCVVDRLGMHHHHFCPQHG